MSGKPMMQAFIDALTVPLTEKEKYKGPAPEPPAAESRFLGRTLKRTCSAFSRTGTGQTIFPLFFRPKNGWRIC